MISKAAVFHKTAAFVCDSTPYAVYEHEDKRKERLNDRYVTHLLVEIEGQEEAIVGYYQILAKPNAGFTSVRLKGLNANEEYQMEGGSQTFFGDELMYVGLDVGKRPGKDEKSGDFHSWLFKLNAVERKGLISVLWQFPQEDSAFTISDIET